MRRFSLAVVISSALLVSCDGPVCACLPPPPTMIVYGRVESAQGIGIPTAVVLYRLAFDTVCVFSTDLPHGEFDVSAVGKTDTTSILILADFASPDSTGVVLRLP